MQKKIEVDKLNIPNDDLDCWKTYPKHRWVFDLSRLLDIQHIEWSPFKTETLKDTVGNMYFNTTKEVNISTSIIYINNPVGKHISTEIYLLKGEIKLLRHIDAQLNSISSENTGNIELKINAFISLHFQKFTGIISIDSINNIIMLVRLKAYANLQETTDNQIIKLINRIYKKTDISVSDIT